MKTKQEQIEKLAQLIGRIKDDCENCDCKSCEVNGEDCCCVHYICATFLVDAGYGDVSEYKSEIDRLRTTLGQCNTELTSALGSMKSQCREIGEMRAKVKQAQIDVLNRVMTYINDKIENDYGDMSDSVNYLTIDIDDFDDFIDELIKEVQNGEDKS